MQIDFFEKYHFSEMNCDKTRIMRHARNFHSVGLSNMSDYWIVSVTHESEDK